MTTSSGLENQPLPWPAQWSSFPVGRNIALFSLLMMLLAGAMAGGTAATLGGDPRGALMIICVPVLTAGVLGYYVVRIRGRRGKKDAVRVAHVQDIHRVAVVVPYSRLMLVAYWIWSVGVVIFFLPFVFIWTLDVLSGGGILEQLGTVALVIGFGLGMLYGLWFLVDLVRGKLARGLVALSSEGIYHRSWSFRGFLPWEGVAFVRATQADGPTIAIPTFAVPGSWCERTSRAMKQVEWKFAPHVAIRGQWLSVDPALLYHALCYYHEHPDARAELSAERGVQRLRAGDLEV